MDYVTKPAEYLLPVPVRSPGLTEPSSVRALVVEDEPKVSDALRRGLHNEGFEVTLAHTLEGALRHLIDEAFDVILLDLMLPDGDGFDLLTTLRSRHVETPVLMLTARDAVEDRIAGLDRGADDYLVKPFAFEELLARVRALLRRPNLSEPIRLSVADLEMDLATRQVTRRGYTIDLTSREFDLLNYLMRHEGRIVSRGMLAQRVWRDTAHSTTLDNVIDVHIARVRRKIDVAGATKLIHTVRGVGFTLRADHS
jgi:two-component system, OmpR family, copper resistance phosphate regulon response regulator CusR